MTPLLAPSLACQLPPAHPPLPAHPLPPANPDPHAPQIRNEHTHTHTHTHAHTHAHAPQIRNVPAFITGMVKRHGERHTRY